MPTLNILDFSCLKEASFTLAPVNVIIGPQGSGKSVTTKLLYFCADVLTNHLQSAEKGDSIEEYKRLISRQFSIWFPPSAWGKGRFNISYSAGPFSIRILRRRSQGRPSDNVSIAFSDWFSECYQQSSELLEQSRDGGDLDSNASVKVTEALDKIWRVRDVIYQRIARELGPEYLDRQTFIPAGRSFFTSIGRLVAGFEQAGSLDPVTIKFARLFANLRDRHSRRHAFRLKRLGAEFVERRNLFMDSFFGGEIKFEDDTEYVETKDGRKIPLTSLSSGQQELLPMWSLMDYFNEMDAFRPVGTARVLSRLRELVYIEEPEAHLFPSAQSLLMEFLIGSVVSEKNHRSLIITTHSPYIMSKLNVFLKAGQLSRRRKRNQDINEIVPRECWLSEKQLAAFALEDGKLRDILDADGLIDGSYLDEISEQISREFSQLLQIESEI